MRAVELLGVQLEETSGALIVLLREQAEPRRVLPLVVGAPEASAIALGAVGTPPPRPLTHDLMVELVEHLGAHLDRVEVTALDEGTFYADLVLEGPAGDIRVDARPSDALALAVRMLAPVYVADDVLDEAGTEVDLVEEAIEEPAVDPIDIEREVDEFRHFLEALDPADFGDELGDPTLLDLEWPTDDVAPDTGHDTRQDTGHDAGHDAG